MIKKLNAYKLAMENTDYNKERKVIILSDGGQTEESKQDDMFEQMKTKK